MDGVRSAAGDAIRRQYRRGTATRERVDATRRARRAGGVRGRTGLVAASRRGSPVLRMPACSCQAQSWLEELDGDPLIAASWTASRAPTSTRAASTAAGAGPRGPPGPDRPLPAVAISAPRSSDRTAAGRPFFDLFLHRLGDDVPANLTGTPEIDEGELCVRAGSPVVAYRSGESELFARVRAAPSSLSRRRRCAASTSAPGSTTGALSASPAGSRRSSSWSAPSVPRSSAASARARWTRSPA